MADVLIIDSVAHGGLLEMDFKFTCKDGDDTATRILPGALCKVSHDGQVVDGGVTVREIFCDGSKHYVKIQGSLY
jgi:hypothetical protein